MTLKYSGLVFRGNIVQVGLVIIICVGQLKERKSKLAVCSCSRRNAFDYIIGC